MATLVKVIDEHRYDTIHGRAFGVEANLQGPLY